MHTLKWSRRNSVTEYGAPITTSDTYYGGREGGGGGGGISNITTGLSHVSYHTHLASQNTEHPLLQVHDGVVLSLVVVHVLLRDITVINVLPTSPPIIPVECKQGKLPGIYACTFIVSYTETSIRPLLKDSLGTIEHSTRPYDVDVWCVG